MKKLLRENWVWIVAPIIIIAVIVIALVVFGSDEGPSPFIYPV